MAAALLLFCALFSDSGRLTFSKSFPGSMPEYFRVTLEENGRAQYAIRPEDPAPVEFRVSPDLAKEAFEIAARLNYFRAALETRKKIAFMGKKTLLYENGAERGEAAFNYSENPDAMALVGLFERISNTQQHIITLDRLARFDRLGLMRQLLMVESALNKNDLAEPMLLFPILRDISTNKSFMGIAQERARIILNKIQTPAGK